MTASSADRFTDRVDMYVKHRPGYPSELMDFLRSEIRLTPKWSIADIGSGTGISSEKFLENGNRVFGVEPNENMRIASVRHLEGFSGFTPVAGTAGSTTLENASVDLVFAAQSFHWFCNASAVNEFQRILRPGGYVGLVWNERETAIDKFHVEYERFLKRFANDYEDVRHDKLTIDMLNRVFNTKFLQKSFAYQQVFDLEGLKGRVVSSSYMPAEGADNFEEMMNELEALFAVYAEIGKITVLYKTKFFYCSI